MSNSLSARFPRPQRNSLLLGLRPIQVLLVVVGVVLAALSLLAGWPALPRLAGLATSSLCGMIAFGRLEGLPAYRWVVLRAAHVIRSWRKQQSYRANVLAPRRHGYLQLPGEASLATDLGHAVLDRRGARSTPPTADRGREDRRASASAPELRRAGPACSGVRTNDRWAVPEQPHCTSADSRADDPGPGRRARRLGPKTQSGHDQRQPERSTATCCSTQLLRRPGTRPCSVSR